VPALSMPCGFSPEGLPIGLQFIGKTFDEETVLRAAFAYEQATSWRTTKPDLNPPL
jgi:aspartyl-tRNA(Asn)/glutamyl-tRNA(Gln) amidotransferase subunit A